MKHSRDRHVVGDDHVSSGSAKISTPCPTQTPLAETHRLVGRDALLNLALPPLDVRGAMFPRVVGEESRHPRESIALLWIVASWTVARRRRALDDARVRRVRRARSRGTSRGRIARRTSRAARSKCGEERAMREVAFSAFQQPTGFALLVESE